MNTITYKQVLDKDGSIEALELWQDDQHITVSLAAEGMHRNGYRWIEVRGTIDRLQDLAQEHASKANNSTTSNIVAQWNKETKQ